MLPSFEHYFRLTGRLISLQYYLFWFPTGKPRPQQSSNVQPLRVSGLGLGRGGWKARHVASFSTAEGKKLFLWLALAIWGEHAA